MVWCVVLFDYLFRYFPAPDGGCINHLFAKNVNGLPMFIFNPEDLANV